MLAINDYQLNFEYHWIFLFCISFVHCGDDLYERTCYDENYNAYFGFLIFLTFQGGGCLWGSIFQMSGQGKGSLPPPKQINSFSYS